MSLKGQNEIIFDRPGVTDTPYPGYFEGWIIEAGKDFFNLPDKLDPFPSITFRKGIHPDYETRLAINYDPYSIHHSSHKDSINLFILAWGHKFYLVKQRKWIPDLALMLNLKSNINLKPEHGHYFGADLFVITQHTWGKFYLLQNFGFFFQTQESLFRGMYGICPGYQVTKNFGLFLEYFLHQDLVNPFEHGGDIGLTYLIANKYQVDLAAGIISSPEIYWWTGIGFSAYIPGKSKKLRGASLIKPQ